MLRKKILITSLLCCMTLLSLASCTTNNKQREDNTTQSEVSTNQEEILELQSAETTQIIEQDLNGVYTVENTKYKSVAINSDLIYDLALLEFGDDGSADVAYFKIGHQNTIAIGVYETIINGELQQLEEPIILEGTIVDTDNGSFTIVLIDGTVFELVKQPTEEEK